MADFLQKVMNSKFSCPRELHPKKANPSFPIKFLWKTMSNDNTGINIYYNAWALKVDSLLKKSCILFYV